MAKPKTPAHLELCKCGHVREDHPNDKWCTNGHGTYFGGCKECKRFVSRNKKKLDAKAALETPQGTKPLWRPDTKRAKKMGWCEILPERVIVYLAQVKVKSPNVTLRNMDTVWAARAQIWAAVANKKICERAMSALEQCQVATRERPARVTITRCSARKLDDDNLIAAMKHVRDGVAEALLFDDSNFSIEGVEPGKVCLSYRQAKSGTGIYGVRVEVFWGLISLND